MSISSSAVDGCDPVNRSVSGASRSLVGADSVGLVVVRYDRTAAPISSVAAESVREGTCDHEADDHHECLCQRPDAGVRRAGKDRVADSSAADGPCRCIGSIPATREIPWEEARAPALSP
jgi:hypothetical protein